MMILGAALTALAAVAAPLLVYSVSLAVFGLAHVGMELRYIDARFGPRVARRLALTIAVLLISVVCVRVAH